jgi:predicted small integral membrane protein
MDWLQDTLGWMYWTVPTAILFGGLFLTIAGLGMWDRISPSYPNKGFLPIATTRGDRLFIGILITIAIHAAWIVLFKDVSLWPATGLAVVVFGIVGARG